jgi:hypothetical protein
MTGTLRRWLLATECGPRASPRSGAIRVWIAVQKTWMAGTSLNKSDHDGRELGSKWKRLMATAHDSNVLPNELPGAAG